MKQTNHTSKCSGKTNVESARSFKLFISFIFIFGLSQSVFSQINVFLYSGTTQSYVVPAGITLLSVDAWGAKGGTSSLSQGGFGGRVTGTLTVVPGSTLNIYVGGMPTTITGGFNGGGDGAVGTPSAAGGGATDIRIGGTGLANRVLVAGGGGGGGQGGGGNGGGLIGANGGSLGTSFFATGGTQSAGGTGGLYDYGTCYPGLAASNGSLGYGGNGTTGVSSCTAYGGAGGGGGYYGGGGMQINGAAGGSSYTDINVTNVTHFQGYNSVGNGQLILTELFGATSVQTNVSCTGGSNGSATVTTTNGSITGPYTYSWIPSGGTSSVASGLSAGSYTCLVSASGNTARAVVNITEPLVLSSFVSTQTNVTCFNGSNGVLSIGASGGTAPYSYTWSPSVASGSIASGLVAGTYTIIIGDANNCATIQQISTVLQPPSFTISGSASSPTICNGGSTTLNGSGAANYLWTGSAVTNGTPFTPTITTTYSVSGTNSLGCLSSNVAAVTVTVYDLPVITVNNGAICFGQTFTITPGGANTYTFSNGSNTVSPVGNSSYSVTGSSSVGCLSSNIAVSSVTVNPIPIITVNSGSMCSGTSYTMVPGGASTYTFTGGSPIVSPISNSSYTVTGTSNAGCISASAAICNVTVHSSPIVSVNSGSICQGQTFTLIPTGASTYTYSSGSNTVSPFVSTSYNIVGTSTAGCLSTNTAVSSLTVYNLPIITVNSGTICSGQSFTIVPNGANTYTYSSGSAIVSPTANQSYAITGTSAEGCPNTGIAVCTVTVYALPTLTISGNNVICKGDTTILNASGATFYSWNTASTNSLISIAPQITTSYSVTGTNSLGCSKSVSQIVQVNPLPLISVTNTQSILCLGESATLIVSGGLTYTWTTNQTDSVIVITPTITSSYSVIGTDSNGCEGSAMTTASVSECTSTNFLKNTTAHVSVFPNPNNGNFTITSDRDLQFSIVNEIGELINTIFINENNGRKVSINNLVNGIYFAIGRENNKIISFKIIVNK